MTRLRLYAATAGMLALIFTAIGCNEDETPSKQPVAKKKSVEPSKAGAKPSSEDVLNLPSGTDKKAGLETATLGAGCFWCIEAVLERIKGVEKVESGYMGGKVKNPTYRDICTGTTGHAEVVRVTFDPKKLSFDKLIDVFWELHDPTTLNRQGADTGTQYRSAIFYHSDEQRKIAENAKKNTDASKKFDDPIVTEITPVSEFYVAEDYHQDYFENNKRQPYCRAVIWPKLYKLGLVKEGE